MVSGVLSGALSPALDGGACPHLAVLLRSEEEFAPVVASFYALGAARGGWLVHRAVEPAGDRVALARAGLDVDTLEAERRLAIEPIRLDEPPEYLRAGSTWPSTRPSAAASARSGPRTRRWRRTRSRSGTR